MLLRNSSARFGRRARPLTSTAPNGGMTKNVVIRPRMSRTGEKTEK